MPNSRRPLAQPRRGLDRGEWGTALVEYALLVALIAVVSIGAVTYLGDSGSDELGDAGTALDGDEEEEEEASTPSAVCAASRSGAYATGPGYPYPCYDPGTQRGFHP